MKNNTMVVLIATSDEANAALIASMLIESRLAACVNIVSGVTSYYRWRGKLHSDREVLLVVKTQNSHFDQIKEEVLKLHSHELPEIIGFDIAKGLPGYLNWIVEETSAND